MRIFDRLFFAFLVAIAAIVPAAAQSAKLVWIRTEEFYNEGTGIPALARAIQQVEREFEPQVNELSRISDQVAALANQAQAAEKAGDAALVTKLMDQRELNLRDYNRKGEELNIAVERRRSVILTPVLAKVTATFPAYAAERKIDAIADAGGEMLFVSPTVPSTADATMDFIQWYNARPAS
jgi:Skp family chaperone for outer membrane proteins